MSVSSQLASCPTVRVSGGKGIESCCLSAESVLITPAIQSTRGKWGSTEQICRMTNSGIELARWTDWAGQ